VTVSVEVRVNGDVVATARADNIMDASTKDYEVLAETVSSLDGSHGEHAFEIGDGRTRHDRNQTVWALVEKIAHTIAVRERQNVNKLPLAPGRKRVAIVFVNESVGDDAGLIATSVTEWTEVSAEEYDKLVNSRYNYRVNRAMGGREFRIIEQPIEQGPIFETLFETLREIEEEEAEVLRKAQAAADERRKKAAERKARKSEDKLRKLIEQDPARAREILEGK
jgi:hypothetical protein